MKAKAPKSIFKENTGILYIYMNNLSNFQISKQILKSNDKRMKGTYYS